MPPTSVSLPYLKKMFSEVREMTGNFRTFLPELLSDDASHILVLRLALNMSQNEFERFLGVESKNISKYERGKIKKMQKETADKYIKKISSVLQNKKITEDQVILAYKRMLSESSGFLKANQGSRKVLLAQRKGAINSLKSRATEQEKSAIHVLNLRGFDPRINFCLNDEKGIITDIFLENFNIAMECKNIVSKNYKQHKEQIRILAYQGYRIKFNFPKIQLIAFVKSNFKLSQRDFEELQGPYDTVLTDVGELEKITFS